MCRARAGAGQGRRRRRGADPAHARAQVRRIGVRGQRPRLHHHRWSQWISARHRGGVYEGEDGKIRDWNASLPTSLIDDVIEPAVAANKTVVILGEEWHTSWSMNLISDALYHRGLRDRVVMVWNANNTFGFNRINWGSLAFATTITTVSRYMKFRMWEWGQNPMVIPNGIPRASIRDEDPTAVADLRAAAGADHFCFKIGRFDPDKRWMMAISAAGHLKRHGRRVKLIIRGGKEPHGGEVIGHAIHQGLDVVNTNSPPDAAGLASLLRENPGADVINLTSFVRDELIPVIYAACDAVLANSGHEPFGLVGLEVMAAGGLAVTVDRRRLRRGVPQRARSGNRRPDRAGHRAGAHEGAPGPGRVDAKEGPRHRARVRVGEGHRADAPPDRVRGRQAVHAGEHRRPASQAGAAAASTQTGGSQCACRGAAAEPVSAFNS